MADRTGFIHSEPASETAVPKITNIFGVSEDFLGQLKTWLEQNPPSIPITNILGFSQFTLQVADSIVTSETTTSSTFGDLATVGPKLTGLSDGKYLLLFGCSAAGVAGVSNANMSIQINSDAVSSDDSCGTSFGSFASVMIAVPKTLDNSGNNTITAKYQSSDNSSTAHFASRWLIALRYANP